MEKCWQKLQAEGSQVYEKIVQLKVTANSVVVKYF